MVPHDTPMANVLEGINAILKRADENIVNLQIEINSFINEHKYPIVGDKDIQMLAEESQHYGRLAIPIRFSVLAGEIIHHFRCVLDHIAWHLAAPSEKLRKPTSIEFPVCADPSKASGVERKIEMISSAVARALILDQQPYQRPNPKDTALWVIHDLDRLYKHREVQLTITVFDLGSPALNAVAAFYAHNPIPEAIARNLQHKMKITPQVAIADFVQGRPVEIIHGLRLLQAEAARIVALFKPELS